MWGHVAVQARVCTVAQCSMLQYKHSAWWLWVWRVAHSSMLQYEHSACGAGGFGCGVWCKQCQVAGRTLGLSSFGAGWHIVYTSRRAALTQPAVAVQGGMLQLMLFGFKGAGGCSCTGPRMLATAAATVAVLHARSATAPGQSGWLSGSADCLVRCDDRQNRCLSMQDG
jgi:hypothetical protein